MAMTSFLLARRMTVDGTTPTGLRGSAVAGLNTARRPGPYRLPGVSECVSTWAREDSNLRPPACKAKASLVRTMANLANTKRRPFSAGDKPWPLLSRLLSLSPPSHLTDGREQQPLTTVRCRVPFGFGLPRSNGGAHGSRSVALDRAGALSHRQAGSRDRVPREPRTPSTTGETTGQGPDSASLRDVSLLWPVLWWDTDQCSSAL